MFLGDEFPWRRVIASMAVVVALCAAVIGALLSREESGLALSIATASGGATDALQAIGDRVPLGYAFAVGVAAAVNPCGFALLPTYLGLYLGTATARGQRQPPPRSVVGRAALVSASMTVSFVGLFGAVGLVLSFLSAAAGAALPWLSLAVGVALVLTGGFTLGGGRVSFSRADRAAGQLGGAPRNVGLMGYVVYGLAFALSSLGCALPLFLAVVGSALSTGGLLAGLEDFVLYALGMGAVVTTLTLSIGFFGQALVGHMRRVTRFVEPLGACLLLLTGSYVVYYWLSVGGLLA